MNFQAASAFFVVFGIDPGPGPQPAGALVLTTGAVHVADLAGDLGRLGSSSEPAADVASYHMAALLWLIALRHSVKPACAAPGSPCALIRLT